MATTRRKTQYKPLRPLREKCPFCEKKMLPSYKNSEELKEYITDRARIMPASRSGVCSKHQRRLTEEIKKARFLALLPVSEKY